MSYLSDEYAVLFLVACGGVCFALHEAWHYLGRCLPRRKSAARRVPQGGHRSPARRAAGSVASRTQRTVESDSALPGYLPPGSRQGFNLPTRGYSDTLAASAAPAGGDSHRSRDWVTGALVALAIAVVPAVAAGSYMGWQWQQEVQADLEHLDDETPVVEVAP